MKKIETEQLVDPADSIPVLAEQHEVQLQADLFTGSYLPISVMIEANAAQSAQSPNLVRSRGEEYFAKGNAFIEHAYTQIKENFGARIVEYNSLAAEIIGHQFAQCCNINVPEYSILIDSANNQLYFGSRRINERFLPIFVTELMMIQDNEADEFFTALWKVFTLDCFLGNIDRHYGNYLLYRKNNKLQIVAIDYGLSSLAIKGWNAGMLPSTTNTIEYWNATQNILKDNHYYTTNKSKYIAAATTLLDDLVNLSDEDKKIITSGIPTEWLSQEDALNFYKWLTSDDYLKRIYEIKRFINHG